MRLVYSSFFMPKYALRRALLLGAPALALVLVNGRASANSLVINGSFELTSNGTNLQIDCGVPQCSSPSTQSTNLTGWTVPANGYNFVYSSTASSSAADQGGANGQYGNITMWGTNNGGPNAITGSPDGGNFVAADGAYEVEPLQQTINGLIPGDTYSLSFDWAAAQQHGYTGATTDQWSVSLGGETEDTVVYDLPSHGFSGWMNATDSFTATSNSELLSFLAIGTPNGEPPFALLDGVSLNDTTTTTTSTTPEPGTLILLLTGGMAGLGALSRRRWLKGSKAAR